MTDARRGVRRATRSPLRGCSQRKDARSTLAGAGAATPDALALALVGVDVREHADLDCDPGEHDEAFLDVWTPEVAPRVARLRASGCRVRCLGDLVLERATRPDDRRHRHGRQDDDGRVPRPASPQGRRSGAREHDRSRREPLADRRAPAPRRTHGVVVLELTSSHLCFTTRSPTVAVVTSLLARPPRAPRLARALPRREGGDRPRPVGGRRGRGERGRRGRRRDRRPLAGSTARVLATARGRRRAPSSAGRRSCSARRTGSASYRYRPARRPAPPGAARRARGRGAVGTSPEAMGGSRSRRSAWPWSAGSPTPSSSTTGCPRRRQDRSRASRAQRPDRSCSSQAASSRAPACPSTHRRRSNDCSRTRARRPRRAARLVVVFGAAAERLAPLLDPDRTLPATSLEDAIARAGATPAAPTPFSSHRCSRCRSRRASRLPASSARSSIAGNRRGMILVTCLDKYCLSNNRRTM